MHAARGYASLKAGRFARGEPLRLGSCVYAACGGDFPQCFRKHRHLLRLCGGTGAAVYGEFPIYTRTEKADIAPDAAIQSVQSKQAILDSFSTFTELMNASITMLVGGALLLGVVVLYNLGVMSYTERYREMATLKVVGFKDRKIGALLIGQNLWLSVIGILIGLPSGIGVLDYLLKALAGEYEMKLALSVRTVCVSICLTLGMSLLVSLAVSRKNKKIDMVEALKSAE